MEGALRILPGTRSRWRGGDGTAIPSDCAVGIVAAGVVWLGLAAANGVGPVGTFDASRLPELSSRGGE